MNAKLHNSNTTNFLIVNPEWGEGKFGWMVWSGCDAPTRTRTSKELTGEEYVKLDLNIPSGCCSRKSHLNSNLFSFVPTICNAIFRGKTKIDFSIFSLCFGSKMEKVFFSLRASCSSKGNKVKGFSRVATVDSIGRFFLSCKYQNLVGERKFKH